MMESNLFHASSSVGDQSLMSTMDGFNTHMFSNYTFQSDIEDQLYITNQEEGHSGNLYTSNIHRSANTSFNTSSGRENLNCIMMNCKLAHDEFSRIQFPSTQTYSTVHPSYLIGSTEKSWISSRSTPSSDYSRGNELSLTLGSSQPSIFNLPNIIGQCSGVMPRDGGHLELNKMNNLTSQEKLSLCCGSSSTSAHNTSAHFSKVLLGSRYLVVIEEILAEISSYATEDVEEVDDSLSDNVNGPKMSVSSCSIVNGFTATGSIVFPFCSEEHTDFYPQEQSRTRKHELINMLQMVEKRFSQCVDQMQNAISVFHSSTTSSCHLPAQFALVTISRCYKNIRNKLICQISSFSQDPSFDFMKEKERSFESSFIQRQWALQQLKRSDHPSWRPQRGLPEKSVSVLRAWMFQNFLHPVYNRRYPKDNEKQLLALKSGLTRSQVSNWFINARVRLWKPMIEEMYAEINRKNRSEEGSSSSLQRIH